MKLGELKQLIEEALEDGDLTEDDEVRIVHQKNYPLQSHLMGVCGAGDIAAFEVDEDETDDLDGAEREMTRDEEIAYQIEQMGGNCLYLVEGGQHYERPYGPQAAWDVARS